MRSAIEHASAASLGLVEADDSRSIRRGKRIDPASCRGVLAYLIRNVEVVDPKRSQNASLGRKRRLGIRDGLPDDVRVETDLRQRSRMTPERRVADSGRPDGSAHTDRGGQLGDPGPLVVL